MGYRHCDSGRRSSVSVLTPPPFPFVNVQAHRHGRGKRGSALSCVLSLWTHVGSEHQGLAYYILVRQAISLLQRTRLNVTVSCQASGYNEPTMLIMGSRVLGQIKG
jgi:hypothetical protein